MQGGQSAMIVHTLDFLHLLELREAVHQADWTHKISALLFPMPSISPRLKN